MQYKREENKTVRTTISLYRSERDLAQKVVKASNTPLSTLIREMIYQKAKELNIQND